jgi:hypothetical protein
LDEAVEWPGDEDDAAEVAADDIPKDVGCDSESVRVCGGEEEEEENRMNASD